MARQTFRIGIDVGGTFTKAALVDHATHAVAGRASVHTTHDHPHGVAAGVVQAFRKVLTDAQVDAGDIVFLAHSTTQATNALLEGDVAAVGVIGMAGERAAKLAREQSHIAPIGLASGRMLRTSNRFLPSDGLEAAAIVDAIEALVADGAQVLVASSAFGVDDTSTEELVRRLGEERGLATTCGHEITRLYGLATRTRTAVINASILPRMIATADMTEAAVQAAGIDAPLMIMRGDGGVMDIHEMRRRPVMTMLSGPAASVAGALMHTRMSDGIYFEVGGTSTNLGVIKGGRPTVTYASIGGHGTYVSSLDVRVLGVAGGSLIQLGAAGIEDVGPRSAHIAGLPYACFADADRFRDATLAYFEPQQADGVRYAAVDTAGGRFALTTTCAANALALTSPDMHCYAPPAAARAAFAPLAAHLALDVETAARRVIETAAAKVIPVIKSLIAEYRLDPDQAVLIGEGGGIGALLPFVAAEMGLRYQISKDAEIISSIGAALAMVREVIERLIPHPTPEDIAAVRAEALAAVTRLGADPKTVDIAIEIDRHTSRVRAVATGAAALRVPVPRVAIKEAEAQNIAAASFGQAADRVRLLTRTPGAFVYGLDRSVRVVDDEGNVRVQRSNATVREASAADWRPALAPRGDDANFSGAIMLYDRHVIDLTGLETLAQACDVVRTELEHVRPETPVVFIGFDRSSADSSPFID